MFDRFKKPGFILFSSLMLSLLFLVACGSSATEAPQAAAPKAAAPKAAAPKAESKAPGTTAVPTAAAVATTAPVVTASGPSGTFNYSRKDLFPYNVFPTLTQGAGYFFHGFTGGENLMSRNAEGILIPRLMKEWDVAADGVTWTFKLEEGVQFHKGYGEMTAEDVIWSMERIGSENSKVAYRSNILRIWGIPEGRTKAIDDYTIEVDTDVPQYDTLSTLSFPHISVFSKKQIADVGEEAATKDVAATGPWSFEEHEAGVFTRWSAVDPHWRKTPEWAELHWRHIPEESTRIANFQTGLLDSMEMNLDSIPAVEQTEGATLMRVPGGTAVALSFYGNWYVGLGTPEHKERAPGFDPSLPWISGNADPESEEWKTAAKVRTALSIAIDRQLIVDTLLLGEAQPDPVLAWAANVKKLPPELQQWEFNPDKARELLAEAGYPDGFTLDITPVSGYNYPEVSEAIAQMWELIGVTAKQQVMTYATIRPQIVNRTYNQVYSHQHVAVDPLDRWAIAFRAGNAWNFGVDHPILEELMDKAAGIVDEEERYAVEVEAARFTYDNALAVGLFAQNLVWPMSARTAPWFEHMNFSETRQLTSFEWAPNNSR